MGSRNQNGTNGQNNLPHLLTRVLGCARSFAFCAVWVAILPAGLHPAHAQTNNRQGLNESKLPHNYRLPMSGSLRENFERDYGQYNPQAVTPAKKRRTIPTLRARYRRQDDDLFGEGQADSRDAAGGSIFDALEDGPQPPATKRPARRNPFGEPDLKNPFANPRTRTPLDPSPREPLMDTRREPAEDLRREQARPGRRDGRPQLPRGSEFTPQTNSVPDLPMPSGATRSTDKAGGQSTAEYEPADLVMPEEEDDLDQELDEFKEGLNILDLDPRDRSPRSGQSSRRRSVIDRSATDRSQYQPRPQSLKSNVYRPAREPSYYARPIENHTPLETNAVEAIVQDAVQHAMRNYAANPANPAVDAYGCGYACPPCPPCLKNAGRSADIATDCGCGPRQGQQYSSDANFMLSQQFAEPASSTCSTAVTDEVYSGVVCGDQEIAAYDPRCFARKTSALGLGLGRRGGLGGLGSDTTPSRGPHFYYGSAFGGWTGLNDLMLSGDQGRIEIANDDGYAAGFALGSIQGKNLRSEIEVTYRSNDLNSMTLFDRAGAFQLLDGDGSIETISGMFNVFWDFTDSPTARFKPYLGAGFGGVSADADFQIDGANTLGDGNDSSLAYQWIGGINYKASELTDFYVEYRYFAADSLNFNTTLPANAIIDSDGELDYRTNNVLFGIRMRF